MMSQPILAVPDALRRRPTIIQGGMGIGVSSWRLARVVSRLGQLGVVSGTALDTVFVRRLQDGDADGHMRRAMAHFPIPGVADAALRRYFLKDGRAPGAPYRLLPMYKQIVSTARQQVTMLANFVEVWLAKEGHDGMVGINLLTKVQMPNLASLYGAMLADVDCVLMGAGIPREIPGALDALAQHGPARLRLDVEGDAGGEPEYLDFDPRAHWDGAGRPDASDQGEWNQRSPLRRPAFLAVVSANSLAATLARKATGRVDGFIVESPTAGGHNAPPRGEPRLTAAGEPIYGDRDIVDLVKMRELDLPFWLAGGAGSPDGLRRALGDGAAGIQVGTLFAYCDESGIAADLRQGVIAATTDGSVRVRTDPRSSPTGYPFKVVEVDGQPRQDDSRRRICDLGYLRTAYRTPDGRLGYRCASEPVETYVAKGGDIADTVGRRCLCNGLTADIGLAQVRDGATEPPLLTSGDDLAAVAMMAGDAGRYSAADVVAYLLSHAEATAA